MDTGFTMKLFQNFESIKHTEDQTEFRSARELQKLLGYSKRENFINVIDKAKISCQEGWNNIVDHFPDVRKMVNIWSGAEKQIDDILLSRYACYLIAQNGDPRKQEIAFAQTYFAVQTRKWEIIENKIQEQERLFARKKLTETESHFQNIAYERWVDGIWLSAIRSKWDQALFGWHSTSSMKEKLWVPKNRPLADFLPAVTIKAKDLATEVTNVNMIGKNLQWEAQITDEHVKNNTGVRAYLGDNNIVPEQLSPAEDIKKVERRKKSESKKLGAK